MFDAVVQSIRIGLGDPLTIVAGLLAGALSRSWQRALAAAAVVTLLLLGLAIATGAVHPHRIAWVLVPANFVAPLAWTAAGFLGRRWHDEGERAGVRLARGLTLGAVVGAVIGLVAGLAVVNLATVGVRDGEASAMTMLAALLGAAVGAIAGMIRAISRPARTTPPGGEDRFS
jgi:hypothetical protein